MRDLEMIYYSSCVIHRDRNSEFTSISKLSGLFILWQNIMIIKQKYISLLIGLWELIFKTNPPKSGRSDTLQGF